MVEWVEIKFSTGGGEIKMKGTKNIVIFAYILFVINCTTIKIPEKKGEFSLYPSKRPGANTLVEKINGQLIKGELITVKDSSLLILESKSAKEVFVDINEVKSIKIVNKSSLLIGLGTGFAVGATGGAILAGAFVGGGGERRAEVRDYLIGALIVGLPGAIIGRIIGGMAGIKRFKIEDMSREEIKETLGKLRSKARVHDYGLYIFKKIREKKHKEIEKDEDHKHPARRIK